VTAPNGITTIKLLSDITITNHASLFGWGRTDYILLGDNMIFDGDGYTVNFGTLTSIYGLFSSNGSNGNTKPIIRNLGVQGGSTANAAGFIVRYNQRCVTVENCYSTGTISGGDAGGIMGLFAGNNGGAATTADTGAISVTNAANWGYGNNAGTGGGGKPGPTPGNRGNSGSAGVVRIKYLGTVAKASGGSISTVGGYTVHTFTSDGTFTII
jgi:hypothetical protein